MPRILVVDDSVMDRRLAQALLKPLADCELDFATDGQHALERIAEHPPDLILTDLIMPRLDGLELVARVRASRHLIPLILMTSQGSEDIAAAALTHGAASYVPKRALAAELFPTVKRVLALQRQWKQHGELMQRLVRSECEFVLGNDTSLIPSLVNYLQTNLAMAGRLDAAERMRIGVALEEALVNAIHHGNLEISSDLRREGAEKYDQAIRERREAPPFCNRQVHVFARFSQKLAEFRIRDEGPGFDPQALPDADDLGRLDRPGGRGLVLMRFVMDEVQFNDQGNEVILRKRIVPETDAEFEVVRG